jgi:hypothetical protein
VRALVSTLLLGLASTSLLSCLGDSDLGSGQPLCPPLDGDPEDDNPVDAFRPVSQVLEARCGTLDCHGAPERPFVVYGQYGFRRPGGAAAVENPEQYVTAGDQATTDYEVQGTFQSLCHLEPEKMSAVLRTEEDPTHLTVVRKPRLTEKHKGGKVWSENFPGDKCLVGWITGTDYADSCKTELEKP